jgi:hypothetical protein
MLRVLNWNWKNPESVLFSNVSVAAYADERNFVFCELDIMYSLTKLINCY